MREGVSEFDKTQDGFEDVKVGNKITEFWPIADDSQIFQNSNPKSLVENSTQGSFFCSLSLTRYKTGLRMPRLVTRSLCSDPLPTIFPSNHGPIFVSIKSLKNLFKKFQN